MHDDPRRCRYCGELPDDHFAFGKCPTPGGAPPTWQRHTYAPPADAAGTEDPSPVSTAAADPERR